MINKLKILSELETCKSDEEVDKLFDKYKIDYAARTNLLIDSMGVEIHKAHVKVDSPKNKTKEQLIKGYYETEKSTFLMIKSFNNFFKFN